jgi:hypothetical protein
MKPYKNKNIENDSFVIFCEILKNTPIYSCICYKRLIFFPKSTMINQKIINKINKILNY